MFASQKQEQKTLAGMGEDPPLGGLSFFRNKASNGREKQAIQIFFENPDTCLGR
jgi:hypothetical protein